MKLVFYSVVLNQHQAPVADELWELTGHQYAFVELTNLSDTKGGTEDYSKRPYLIRAWENQDSFQQAMNLAKHADCCVFSGVDALPFQKERMRLGLLSFDMGERWLKHGIKSLASPRLVKWLMAYYLGGWRHKPLYKLCCSAFCAKDHYALGTFKDKCYKWGYFTKVDTSGCETNVEASTDVSTSEITPLMWCGRFLMLKHPELPILMAERLKRKGYKFLLDMYGEGEYREAAEHLAENLGLRDCVSFIGNKPNTELMKDMQQHEIFLFTSDKNEGWGAVANESMSNGCVLVGSDALGCAPYLIKDGENGFMFKSSKVSCTFKNPDKMSLDSLCEKVEWLLEHPEERKQMRMNAREVMTNVWSPRKAAEALLKLIDDLKNGKETSIKEGPCSKA